MSEGAVEDDSGDTKPPDDVPNDDEQRQRLVRQRTVMNGMAQQ
jgi:hypothetical protein